MSRTKTKAKSLSFWDQVRLMQKDERHTKILAMITFMLAIYLSISFISYLFSWKTDQDKVLHFGWRILLHGEVNVENWLGRLGAWSSHLLFYYGYGIAGFLAIPVLVHLGFRFLTRGGWMQFLRFLSHSMLIMVLCSMVLDFLGKNSAFPWGGAFGDNANHLISGVVGEIGLGVTLIFGLLSIIVWFFNPSFQALQVAASGSTSISSFWSGELFHFKSFYKNSNSSVEGIELEQVENGQNISGQRTDLSDFNEPFLGTLGKVEKEEEEFDDLKLEPKTDSDIPKLEIIEPDELPIDNKITESKPSLFPQTMIEEDHWDGSGLEAYDPRKELSSYQFPDIALLNDYNDQKFEIDRNELEANKNQIIATLQHYKIEIHKIKATIGPTVTLYEIVPAPGVRISRIKSLEDDIALSLSAQGIRIIAPIPGKGTIGIEVANKNKQVVALKDLLRSERFNDPKMELPLALGKNISNEVVVADLTKMPHLLIAGATGQGKSVGINSILMSILYRKHPSEVKLVLIDPKKVELPIYTEIEKHFLAQIPNQEEAIITDTSKVIYTLNSLCIEMDQRYELLKLARVRNLLEYNEKFTKRKLNPEKGHKYLPYIVLIIDEFADLIMTAGKEVEMPIGRLAQLARAVGIHLIIATQRPSVKIITGLIKANFPGRLAFKVSSNIDSRTILDYGGAERLIGRGDMLYSAGSDMIRLQCPFVDTPEVERVIKNIAAQQSYSGPYLLPEFKGEDNLSEDGNININDLDDMFEESARLVVQSQHGSTSMIQRRLKLGYNRAGRIMDQLESVGIVSSGEGSKPREVLVFNEIELENILKRFRKQA